MVKIKEWIGKLPKKTFFILGAVIAALIIVIVVITVLPSNVEKRNIKKGDAFYINGNYEKAAACYEKALSKDELNEKTYYSLICSYMAYDMEMAYMELKAFDENTALIFEKESCDSATVADIYLLAPQIMTEDMGVSKAELAQFLENANSKVKDKFNSTDLINPFYDSSLLASQDCVNSGDYVNALIWYLKAFETNLCSETEIAKMKEAANLCVEQYLAADDFDSAREIVKKYSKAFSLDEALLISKIDESNSLYDTKVSLLKKVYDAMNFYYDLAGKDFSESNFENAETALSGMLSVGWVEMVELDGSDEAETLAKSLTQTAYVYAPDYSSDYTGLGCGLYTYGDPVTDEEGNVHVKYYFYFGNYKNGVRSGYGFSFAESKEGSYRGFEGNWENDAPEGFGAEYISNYISKNSTVEYQSVIYGNFKKGIENGTMTALMRLTNAAEEVFRGTYEATDGVAPAVPTVTKDYELLTEVPEDQVVIAVIPSISKGYDIYNVLYEKTDNKLAALGF